MVYFVARQYSYHEETAKFIEMRALRNKTGPSPEEKSSHYSNMVHLYDAANVY